MKLSLVNSSGCLLVCLLLCMTGFAIEIPEDDGHPILHDFVGSVVDFVDSLNIKQKNPAVAAVWENFVGSDNWSMNVKLMYQYKNINCEVDIHISDSKIEVKHVSCLPVKRD
ncbi:hypothetical protein RUM43_009690 [Polyplax serrata]|uniref:Uncharacterized protein n=1 Tax=Polyplax serrata TaxID=468196 RepID=A0AAN8P349_POLSC